MEDDTRQVLFYIVRYFPSETPFFYFTGFLTAELYLLLSLKLSAIELVEFLVHLLISWSLITHCRCIYLLLFLTLLLSFLRLLCILIDTSIEFLAV